MSGIPFTRVDIISNAFIWLGLKKIKSIAEGGEVAADADQIFDILLAHELSNPNWRFATSVKTISKLAGIDPDYKGYSSAYDKPAGLLAIHAVWPNQRYDVYGDRIWTSGGTDKIQCEYREVVSLARMPPSFLHYFSFVLAYNLGLGLTETNTILDRVERGMNNARAQAMVTTSQERPNQPIKSGPWVQNRGDGYGGLWGVR